MILTKMPHDVDRDMVAAGNMAVEEQAVQGGLAGQFNAPLLLKLAPQRAAKTLAGLNAAARQVPAGDIAVLDQEHPVAVVQYDRADPQSHPAGDSPIEMKDLPQVRLEPPSQVCRIGRHRTAE